MTKELGETSVDEADGDTVRILPGKCPMTGRP